MRRLSAAFGIPSDRRVGSVALLIVCFIMGVVVMHVVRSPTDAALHAIRHGREISERKAVVEGAVIAKLSELSQELHNLRGRELLAEAPTQHSAESDARTHVNVETGEVLTLAPERPAPTTSNVVVGGTAGQRAAPGVHVQVNGLASLARSFTHIQHSMLKLVQSMTLVNEHRAHELERAHTTTATTTATTLPAPVTKFKYVPPPLPEYYVRSLTHGSCVDVGPNGVVPFICKQSTKRACACVCVHTQHIYIFKEIYFYCVRAGVQC